MKLDRFVVIWIIKGDILFISDINSFLIVPDVFPRFDEPLGKRKMNIICTLIWSCLTD
jgi:hypothetical protein